MVKTIARLRLPADGGSILNAMKQLCTFGCCYCIITTFSILIRCVLCQGGEDAQLACERNCEIHDTMKAYENCLRRCYNYVDYENILNSLPATVSNKTYAKPPANVTVVFSVRKQYASKHLKAVVHWDAETDSNREAFYLIFTAKSEACELLFPGYYALKIPAGLDLIVHFKVYGTSTIQDFNVHGFSIFENVASARSWEIPTHTVELLPLTLNFGCRYRVELRSEPYVYGDPNYAVIVTVKIPTCVDSYCSCSAQPRVARPEIRSLVPFWDAKDETFKALLTWNFRWPKEQQNVSIEFHVRIADLIRKANVPPWRNVFRLRPAHLIIQARQDQQTYEALLVDLKNQTDYQVQIFALSQHLCKSKEVLRDFFVDVLLQGATNYTAQVEVGIRNTVPNFSTPLTEQMSTVALYTELANTTENPLPSASAIPVPTVTTHEHYLIAILPTFSVLLIVIAGISCHLYRRKGLKPLVAKEKFLRVPNVPTFDVERVADSIMETNILYTEKEISDAQRLGLTDQFEISYDRLTFGRVIGQGAFGLVYIGFANSIRNQPGQLTVAIKQIKGKQPLDITVCTNASEEEKSAFRLEIDTMKLAGNHPNIIQMYGCVTLQDPNCMVMEYIPYGDLLQYLKTVRKEYEKRLSVSLKEYVNDSSFELLNYDGESAFERKVFPDSQLPKEGESALPRLSYSLDAAELQNFALQIANGMAHLESLCITHRDLAARNVLVGRGKCLKISDFGLSRSGIYVKTTSGRVPLRWLSIEAMRDHTYSTKSDMWAYGVVLWEICTLGGFPYSNVPDKEILLYLESGKRLEKPVCCSDAIYQLMLQCWSELPEDRPSFLRMQEMMKELTQGNRMYVDFYDYCDSEEPRGALGRRGSTCSTARMHWFTNSYQRSRESSRLADRPAAVKLAGTIGSKTLPMEQPRKTTKCYCCPYGYHIDLDFVKYAENNNSSCRLYPTNLRHPLSLQHGHQRRSRNLSKYHHSTKQTSWKKPGSQEGYCHVDKYDWTKAESSHRRLMSPNELAVDSSISSCIFSDSLENLVSDFEETLSRSSGTLPRGVVVSRNDKDYCSDNELEAFRRNGSFRTPAIKASSGRTEGYTSDCAYLPACLNKYRNAARGTTGLPASSLTESKPPVEVLRSINGGETRPNLSSVPAVKSVSIKGNSGKEAPSRSAGASMPVFLNLSGEVATDLHNLSNSMRSSESPISLTSDSCLATSDASNLGQEVSKSVSELLEAVHRHMKHSLNHIEHLENRIRLSPRMTYEMCRIKDEKESLARQWNAAASKELSSRRKGFSSKADHAGDTLLKGNVRRGDAKMLSSTSLMDETSCKVPYGEQKLEVEEFAAKTRKPNSTSLNSAYAAREHSRSGRSFSSGSDLGCSLKSHGVTESLNLNSFPSIRRLSSGSSTPVSNGRRRFGKVVNYTSDSEIASRSADCAASLRRSKHLLRYPHNDLGNFSNHTVPRYDENIPIAKLDCQTWTSAKFQSSSNVLNRPESGQQSEKKLAQDIPSPSLQTSISATVSQSITGRHTTSEQPQAVKWDEDAEKLEAPTEVAIQSLRLDTELVEAKVVQSNGQTLNSPVGNVNERLCSVCQEKLTSIERNRTEISTTEHATETDNCLCLVCVKLRAKSLVTRAVSTDTVVKVDMGTKMPLVEHTAVEKHDKTVETEKPTVVASKDCAVETERLKVQCAEVSTENPGYCSIEVCTDALCVADASSEVEKAFLLASGYWKHANVSTETPLKNSIGFNTDPCKMVDPVERMDCCTSTDCQVEENIAGPSSLLQSTGIQACTELVEKSCSTTFVAHNCSATDTKDLITKANAMTNTEEKKTLKTSIGTNTMSNLTSRSVRVGACHEDTAIASRRRSAETNTDRPKLLDSSSMTEPTIMFSKAVATSLKTRDSAVLTKIKTMTIGTSTHVDPFSESILPEVTDSTFDTDRKKFRLSALTSPLSWKRRNAPSGSEKSPIGRSFDSSPASPVANSEDEHSISKEPPNEDNILPLELDVELVPMETNPFQEEEIACLEDTNDRLFSLEESQYSDDSALDDEDTEPSSSQGARSPTHKFDITKPRPTRAFHLSKAAAVKKLLTIDKSNRASSNSFANGYFRRSTAASSSVRVAKNKGDHLAFIESKCSSKDKQQRSDRQPMAAVRGAKGRPEVKKLTSDDPSSSSKEGKKGKAPLAASVESRNSKLTLQDAQSSGQDEPQPMGASGKRADKRKFHSANRQGTVAVSDSETSEIECPTTNVKDEQSHKRPKAANDLIRRSSQRETLEEALRLLEESSKVTTDSVDELQEWARHYVQHTWLKAAARRTADAAQVEKFLKLVETRGQQLLKMVVNVSDENDNSALHYSVSHGNFDVVSLLLDCKQCEVDKPNKAGYTPAMLAALSADLTDTNRMVMQRLFQMADVNIRTKQHGQTAIMLAASHGKMDAVTMLIENGADVNMQDEDGSTALMCAAEHGHKEIVRLLLDIPQIDASMVDQEGSTALAIAVENGYKDIGLLIYAHLNHDHSSLPGTRDYL
ncbi:hypothetical protein M514_02577 [Trichuris suis]|uniref:Protein kinase domain-containing protein n=1 Tax=Trichuris suis TaxID=68888 RepID=A0A085NNF4_9BILA|nr:hypothetical protein M514_02577 [Trichuris suis]